MTITRRVFSAAGLLPAALTLPPILLAQGQAEKYPSKPVRIVVPYAPGGGTDVLGRLLAARLSEALGGPAFVENKPGANSIIGASFVAKAPPDGYTLLVGAVGTVAVNQAVYADLPYNPTKDFAPVSLTATSPMTLIVPRELPVTNIKELVAYAQANPNQANYGSSGTPFHLMAELLIQRTKARITNVPYKGTAAITTAVIAGEMMMAFVDAAPVIPLAQAGRLRVLAVTTAKRHPSLPDVPTLIEEGVLQRPVELWSGLFAPAGTPAPIVQRLAQEIERWAKQADARVKLAPHGIDPVYSTPAVLAEMVAADIKLWSDVAAAANIRLTRS